mmetsp:Transcript_589/g.1912  ORF Transcript_589/g.1912 Transcript_589/m.1912 type:complete len:521 (+) Transcript_589:203-1765(+)
MLPPQQGAPQTRLRRRLARDVFQDDGAARQGLRARPAAAGLRRRTPHVRRPPRKRRRGALPRLRHERRREDLRRRRLHRTPRRGERAPRRRLCRARHRVAPVPLHKPRARRPLQPPRLHGHRQPRALVRRGDAQTARAARHCRPEHPAHRRRRRARGPRGGRGGGSAVRRRGGAVRRRGARREAFRRAHAGRQLRGVGPQGLGLWPAGVQALPRRRRGRRPVAAGAAHPRDIVAGHRVRGKRRRARACGGAGDGPAPALPPRLARAVPGGVHSGGRHRLARGRRFYEGRRRRLPPRLKDRGLRHERFGVPGAGHARGDDQVPGHGRLYVLRRGRRAGRARGHVRRPGGRARRARRRRGAAGRVRRRGRGRGREAERRGGANPPRFFRDCCRRRFCRPAAARSAAAAAADHVRDDHRRRPAALRLVRRVDDSGAAVRSARPRGHFAGPRLGGHGRRRRAAALRRALPAAQRVGSRRRSAHVRVSQRAAGDAPPREHPLGPRIQARDARGPRRPCEAPKLKS